MAADYSEWVARQNPTMRQVHRAGERLLVDYSSNRPSIVDRSTGEAIDVELFVT